MKTTTDAYRHEHHRTPLAADVAARMLYIEQNPRPDNVRILDDGLILIDLPVSVYAVIERHEDGSVEEWFFNSISSREAWLIDVERDAR